MKTRRPAAMRMPARPPKRCPAPSRSTTSASRWRRCSATPREAAMHSRSYIRPLFTFPFTLPLPRGSSSVSGSFRSRGEGLALVGPCERLGGRVVAPDEGEQLGPEVGLRLEDAAAEEPAGEDREEQLDLVEPGGVGGGEVEGPAGVGREPGLDLRGLVDLEVVEDCVHLLAGGDLVLEPVEEVDEL